MPLEANDRGLAQHRLDDSAGPDGVITYGRPGTGARIGDENHALADAEWWGRLLTSARRPPRSRRWSWDDCNDDRRGNGSGDLLLVIVLVVVDDGDDPDLDLDLVGVVQLDSITLGPLGGRCVGFVRFGVSGGVDWFCWHSGSCGGMGRLRRR
jgi:hypothetical protein